MPAKNLFLTQNFLLITVLLEDTFTSFFKDKKVKKSHEKYESRFLLLFLHDDRRIRIRKAQKNVEPVDPDPQHCL
jgi:hypothetical protein